MAKQVIIKLQLL